MCICMSPINASSLHFCMLLHCFTAQHRLIFLTMLVLLNWVPGKIKLQLRHASLGVPGMNVCAACCRCNIRSSDQHACEGDHRPVWLCHLQCWHARSQHLRLRQQPCNEQGVRQSQEVAEDARSGYACTSSTAIFRSSGCNS